MKKFGTAVILAGGKSTRMGFDKQILKINENKMIDIIIKKLREEFEEVIVVSNKPEYYNLRHKVVTDEIKERGPLSGIHVGLKNALSEYVYFVACDMPHINSDYIKYIKNEITDINVDCCITRYGEWIEPFNSFYNKSMIRDIEEYLNKGRRSIFRLVDKLNCYYISEEKARTFSPNWNMFLNLNTKEDLKDYLSRQISI